MSDIIAYPVVAGVADVIIFVAAPSPQAESQGPRTHYSSLGMTIGALGMAPAPDERKLSKRVRWLLRQQRDRRLMQDEKDELLLLLMRAGMVQ